MISAEAEQCTMVPALAEARQVQLFLIQNREGTHIILETDWSAAKAIVKRSVAVLVQDGITNQKGLVASSRNEKQCCRQFDKTSESANTPEQNENT